MKNFSSILTITGSDGTGRSGLQVDIKNITNLGGIALSVTTCLNIHKKDSQLTYNIPTEVIIDQTRTLINEFHPQAAKIELIQFPDVIKAVRDEIIGIKNIVCAPSIFDTDGSQIIDDASIEAILNHIAPESKLLILRHADAEKILDCEITSDDDMMIAAKKLKEYGSEWVMIRESIHTPSRISALLYGEDTTEVFTSRNINGWRKYGVASAYSAAIATHLAMGEDIAMAIKNAHEYVNDRVVCTVIDQHSITRGSDLFNSFVNLVADNYQKEHSVSFYATQLSITTRYLSQISDKTVGKSPKQIIANYIINEAKSLLKTSRLSIQEISDKLGFSSQTMFCKFFKTKTHKTPTAFRIDDTNGI